MSCLPVAEIVADDCGANPGGTNTLWVARKRHVKSIPEPTAGTVIISEPIVMEDGFGFVKWDHAQDTGEINHGSVGDPGNKSVKTDVNTYVPRGNPDVDAQVNAALNGEFIVIVEDGLGQKRIAGDKRRGMIFDHDYKSGKKGTDKNGTDFKFAAEGLSHVPYYYQAAIPVAAAVAVPGGE